MILRILSAPDSSESYDGGTVVARRSVLDAAATLEKNTDLSVLRDLFQLLHDLSGRVDPDVVLSRIADAVLARFPHAGTATVMMAEVFGGRQVNIELLLPRNSVWPIILTLSPPVFKNPI